MTTTHDPDPFLDWLDEQDDYVENARVHEKWPTAQFRSMDGVTTICEGGVIQTPRRDFRAAYVVGSVETPDPEENEAVE